ncbi:MAG TPA: Ig-like domain-containing protein [Longimicrobium sp.]|jgi:hypothetical protein
MIRTAGLWLSAALLALSVAGCEESPVTLADLPEATSFASTVTELRLVAGGTGTIPGQVLDQNGRVMADARVVFVSDNPLVASVGLDGTVRGTTPGTANVTAVYGRLTAITRVTVARDESGFIRTVDLQADSVAVDVEGTPAEIVVRSFTAGGAPACPAFTLTTSDGTVASVNQFVNPCRIMIRGVFPGRTVVRVSAEGVSDSLRVTVSAGAPRLSFFFPTSPTTVGSTVWLGARATDKDGNVLPGRTVNFNVSRGRLSATSAVTDATGLAAVQYTVPTRVSDEQGSLVLVSFAATLNGIQRSGYTYLLPAPGPIESIQLFRLPNPNAAWVPIQTGSVGAGLYEHVRIGASGLDRYGNYRSVEIAGASADYDNFEFTVSPATARDCTKGITIGPNSNGMIFTCIRSNTPGTVRVVASAGGVTQGVDVVYAAR